MTSCFDQKRSAFLDLSGVLIILATAQWNDSTVVNISSQWCAAKISDFWIS